MAKNQKKQSPGVPYIQAIGFPSPNPFPGATSSGPSHWGVGLLFLFDPWRSKGPFKICWDTFSLDLDPPINFYNVGLIARMFFNLFSSPRADPTKPCL